MKRGKIYTFYRHRVYPYIKNLRGSTRLNEYLSRISEIGVEKIDEDDAESVFEKAPEWDNLVILDACRHDLYVEVVGETESRISLGSRTSEFLKKTFRGCDEDLSEYVYVTANPHFYDQVLGDELNLGERFYEVFKTFETDWDGELGTVKAPPVVRDAKTAEKLFPDKKKIIHLMQPHHPMIESDLGDGFSQYLDKDMVKSSVWGLAERGLISQERAWSEYKRNLRYVLPYVTDLIKSLDGVTVVTSDHGNLVGANGRYGHPKGSDSKALREVPWDVYDE